MPGYPCCCGGCVATFTMTPVSGNEYTFTDTSPGSHTRVWTASDGGTSTSSPWTHTFPDDAVYSVTLTNDYGGDTCDTTKYVGDTVTCSYCDPTALPQTIYAILEGTTAGPEDGGDCDDMVLPQLDDTWAIDDPFDISCLWESNYDLGSCETCPNESFSYEQVLRWEAYLEEIGFPTVTDVKLHVKVRCEATSISIDCTEPIYGGGGAHYEYSYGSATPECRGSFTMTRVTDASYEDDYIEWPSTLDVIIPTV